MYVEAEATTLALDSTTRFSGTPGVFTSGRRASFTMTNSYGIIFTRMCHSTMNFSFTQKHTPGNAAYAFVHSRGIPLIVFFIPILEVGLWYSDQPSHISLLISPGGFSF